MGPPYWPRFCPMGFSNSPHSPKGGSEKKYRARPNRLWGHSKGRLGAPEPHLSDSILPWIRPERRKPLFWPLGLSVSFRYPRVHCTGPPPPSLARIPPQLAPGVAGSNGGPIPHQFPNWFYRYCAPPPRTLVIKVCQRPLQVHTVLQMGLQTEPGAIWEFFMHQDPPFGTKGTH